jgi:hypothetical protein
MGRAARWLAIGFALFLAVAEAVRNRNGWQWWPFWTVDYLAAALLLAGALGWRRPTPNPLLTGGWGFAAAMFWMSFFGHVENVRGGAEREPDELRLTVIIGVLFAITLIGFALSMADAIRRRGP